MLSGFDAKPLKKALLALLDEFYPRTGLVEMDAGATPPKGALSCNGQAVSRQTYGRLYRRIGTTHGVGDGSTTFNLPNLKDRMPIGAGNLYALAATGGSKDAIVVSHSHTVTGTTNSAGSHAHNTNYRNFGSAGSADALLRADTGDGATSVFLANDGVHSHTTSGTAATTGSSGTDANLPPYVGMNFIIWT